MTRARDSQKSKLYAAERVIPNLWGDQFGSVELTQKWLDEVLAARWFRSRWRLNGGVRVVAGRGGAHAGWGQMHVGRQARNPWVVLHELAHEVVTRATVDGPNLAWHGPEFAAVFLFLVRQVMGAAEAVQLREAFIAKKVRHRAAGAVPAPRYAVPSQAEERARRVQRLTKPLNGADHRLAVGVIRRAVKAGVFGAAGTKARTHALAVARTLEKASPSTG